MSEEEEEGYIRKAVEAFKATSPSGKVPVGVSLDACIPQSLQEANVIVVLRTTVRAISSSCG